jgi:hypothetical protein
MIWNLTIRLGKFALDVEATQPGQPDIEDETGRNIRELALQELRRRPEKLGAQAHRAKKPSERLADRRVVLDVEDDRLIAAGDSFRRRQQFPDPAAGRSWRELFMRPQGRPKHRAKPRIAHCGCLTRKRDLPSSRPGREERACDLRSAA